MVHKNVNILIFYILTNKLNDIYYLKIYCYLLFKWFTTYYLKRNKLILEILTYCSYLTILYKNNYN